ncbi:MULTISPECIES: hypothetical protein [unclassified Niallia]|uniref:hypothetical protein n=1 Tax=unclassified Niallia TaxID=2837522 RepID=UPI001EDB03FD|nr:MULTISPECIES: hypothetical protein [unclassified Niallia]MCM3034148.1 hypothetical protein [Niallia sp. MER 6]UPO90095.1 hypothetical protein L8T27_025370 [Niallia sp. Man26]
MKSKVTFPNFLNILSSSIFAIFSISFKREDFSHRVFKMDTVASIMGINIISVSLCLLNIVG